jgi:acetylornithine/N-succinyldiaminopimelate aminotransferase
MNSDIMSKAETVIASTYKRFPLVLTRGKGCTVWDINNKAYTDFVSGIAVCNLGHADPEVAAVLSRQAETLVHVSNLYYTVPQVELAEWLTSRSFADRVFFCNSGAEANEAAIKLARKYFHDQGKHERFRIITMEQSFHGRTFATLSATGQLRIRFGFDPVLNGFEFIPFNDIGALKKRLNDDICAVMMEPIQGEGGIRVPDPGFLREVRDLCDQSGALLIFDEVQTGIGRTGKLFAYEHFDIAPDIMSLAKALGNGLPIGAMLAREKYMSAFTPGTHASTFGGTPLVSSAALAVLRLMEERNIVGHCERVGAYFRDRLLQLKDRHDMVTDVRGMGLLVGMKLNTAGAPIVEACMESGFLINCVQEDILRFIPPLIITEKEIDALIDCLDKTMRDFKYNK